MNRCKKKVIPWHVQQRYMESSSQFSLNQTISTAIYKKKIKSLQRNNRQLALALQKNRCLATDKENLLVDNGKILNIINFSRVKLMDLALNMKQATECLDETLLLLNMSLNDSLSKHSPNNLNYRNDLKSKLQELSRNSPIEEVSENSDTSNKIESHAQKGKRSHINGCVSSTNKKCKLTKKGSTIKINCKDLSKSSEESSSTVSTIDSKNTSVKNSEKFNSTHNIKAPNRKNSLSKNCTVEPASSSKLPSLNSNISLQAKTKRESLCKKRKAVKVILTDIAEAFLTKETGNYNFPTTNGPTVASNSTNDKCFTPNSLEDNILIKKYFSSELTCKQNISPSNSCGSQFATINNTEVTNCSHNSSNFSWLTSSSDDIAEIDQKAVILSSVKDEFCVGDQFSSEGKMEVKEDNITKQNNGICIEKTDSERDKMVCKSHNSKATNRVHFYFDEDAIVKVEGNTVASKDKIRKPINKCKARKTVSHKKKNIPSESTAQKSFIPDNISKLGKNSFLVTAEVHSPPNGIYVQEMKTKLCTSKKMEPRVVLTDIFKSNQNLLSEMVGNSVWGNGCLQKTVAKSAESRLSERNMTGASYMDYEIDTENRCLPEDIEIIDQRKQRRRSKIVSYKEPSEKVKMRRLF